MMKVKMNRLNELKEIAFDNGIELLVAEVGDAAKQGIHLLNPTLNEIEFAMHDADRDGFVTIYCHTVLTYAVTE